MTTHKSGELEWVHVGGPFYAQHLARYRWVRDRIPGGALVLDAGCGAGYGTAVLAEAGRPAIGLDAAGEALRTARGDYGAAARFVHGDVLSMPFSDATFDVVACLEVIEHIRETGRLVAELARVLKPGGALYLSTPHAVMEELQERAIGMDHYHGHVSSMTPGRLKRLLGSRFGRVRLWGQTQDLGTPHLLLKAVDVFGLRLRLLRPERQHALRKAIAGEAAEQLRYRFSRLISRSAAMIMAEARK